MSIKSSYHSKNIRGLNGVQADVEKKYKKREKKKKRAMKISGASTKGLQKIIKDK